MSRLLCILVVAGACGDSTGAGPTLPGPDAGGAAIDAAVVPDAVVVTGPGVTVTVEVGTGGGRVTSDVPGIDCGTTCTAPFDDGAHVVLTAAPAAGSAFIGWRGDGIGCGRNLTCAVVVDGGRHVGALFAEIGTAGWVIPLGASEPVSTMDKDGNLVVAMENAGSIDLGGTRHDSRGQKDVLVAKLSPAGDPLWAREIGGAGFDFASAVAVDPANGDVVVLGAFTSAELDLGGPTPLMSDNQEAVDLFAVRYAAADGAWQWQKRIASRGNTFAFGLGVDGHGDALVGGTFTTSVDLGLGPLETNGSVPAIFVGKLDGATGDAMWRRKIDDTAGAGFATLAGLVVDSHDDFVLAGGFGGRIDLAGDGPDGDLSTQTLDGYVAKLSGEDGGLVWQKQIGAGSTADGSVASVTLAPDDSVTLVAQYGVEGDTKVVFLGRELAGAGGSTEVVVGRLAGADGGLVWARRFGGPGSDQGNFVAALADGGVVVAGGCTASFSFDDHPVAFSGVQEDSFFAILDETGTATYATRVGSLDFDRAVGAAVVGRSLIGVGRVHDQGAFLGKTFDPPGGASGYAFQVTLP